MALPATLHRWQVEVSDVDRGVYQTLDLRLAQHPSESVRFLVTRALAYCLSYEDGIAFSKGGVSSSDEPPVSIRDATGRLVAWIDVGSPSAARLHKATKAAARVLLFTTASLEALRRDARGIFRAESIQVFRLPATVVQALEACADRQLAFELVRSDGQLYLTLGGETLSGAIEATALVEGGNPG